VIGARRQRSSREQHRQVRPSAQSR
jgi:hypothetical protein